ncbi:hypothetical protein [Aquisalimonas sp.]|nr:hypothetical protein [Aquisalimonas sp.]
MPPAVGRTWAIQVRQWADSEPDYAQGLRFERRELVLPELVYE